MYVKLSIGIDIGGTFTDIIVQNKETGEIIKRIKVSTTPKHPENAIMDVFKGKLTKEEKEAIQQIYHATTIATNALLGQVHLELPKTVLITTKGFRDVLEIGRQRRPSLYDFFFDRPKPVIPRRFRLEVEERMNYKGEVIVPINQSDLERTSEFIARENVKSVAVSFLHSYANPRHEQIVKQYLEQHHKNLYISLSSEVSPEHREFERTSTTAINAVLMPIVSRYINSLEKIFAENNVKAPLFIMQSNGGVSSAEHIQKLPVSIIESGPSAGVVATRFLAEFLGLPSVISFDMGGTTAKAGTVIDKTISLTTEYEVGGEVHSGRITKGSGYPVRFPFVDLAEISSGGGSIAWVDEGNALRVGPISAGADPGPACYGKGGENPTITDANLVLGRINPRGLLNETFPIYPHLSEKSINEKIGEPLGLSVIESAIGIIKIANMNMSRILRIVTVERGLDPRKFVMVAFGGAGPMHACSLAEELGIKEVLIPEAPGLFSAMGLLFTDVMHTFVKSIRRKIDEVDPGELNKSFEELESKGNRFLEEEGFSSENVIHQRLADLRYSGQGFELLVPLSDINLNDKDSLLYLRKLFDEKHKSVYGYSMEEEAVEIVNIRVNSIGIIKKPVLRKIKQGNAKPPKAALKGHRNVFFEQFNDFEKTPVFERARLKAGNVIEGPAIIEQYDSTVVIPPNWTGHIDAFGIIHIKRV